MQVTVKFEELILLIDLYVEKARGEIEAIRHMGGQTISILPARVPSYLQGLSLASFNLELHTDGAGTCTARLVSLTDRIIFKGLGLFTGGFGGWFDGEKFTLPVTEILARNFSIVAVPTNASVYEEGISISARIDG